MKTRKYFLNAITILAAVSFTLTSCKKEDEDTDTSGASDNALAESTYQDAANIADEAGTGALSNYRIDPENGGLLTTCATITRDSANSADADTITVDFGSVNCYCNDGRNRRGKILIVYNGTYRDSGSTWTITFDNYFVNDNQVMGSKTVTNNGHNSAGHLVYSINVNGTILLANNGGTITWTSQRQREWTAGESTPVWYDDTYSITGSASGTGASGNTFTANITNPLIRNMAFGCRRHFVQGTFEFTPSNKPMRTVDFGNGACDDIATVTINNHVYTIHLR
ncbi:MAG: hypothetical protein FD123_1419 [Bacteroidetes bacterium]|nr:MAG: hypothetical protein FD123_1419 [Bacteroidota bacterium]